MGSRSKKKDEGSNVAKIIGIGAVILVGVLALVFLIKPIEKDVNTYKVIFSSEGDNNEVVVDENDRVSRPSDPVREGYTFDGWYYAGEKFDFSTKITKDMTLEARWTKNSSQEWTVRFDTNGGNTIENLKILDGESLSTLPAPERKGYIFKGWYKDSLKVELGAIITEDITLVAKWEKEEKDDEKESASDKNNTDTNNTVANATVKYTVKFDTDGGNTIKSQKVVKNGKVSKPSDPKKDGFTFDGWYLGNTKYNFSSKVVKNITLVAKYTKNTEVTYKVESIETSLVGQAKLYILKDDVKVAGTIDLTNSSGVTKTYEVPEEGIIIVDGIYEYSNPKVN